MELPPALRQAVDAALEGVSARDLAAASDALVAALSRRGARRPVSMSPTISRARAYLAARLPATYAAIRARAGCGRRNAAGIRAAQPARFRCRSRHRALGRTRLLAGSRQPRRWSKPAPRCANSAKASRRASRRRAASTGAPRFRPGRAIWSRSPMCWTNSIPRNARPSSSSSGRSTADTLLIVEPGTPAGWQRILDARALLLKQGAQMVAPCPHAQRLSAGRARLVPFLPPASRSRAHLQAKGAEVPWEDEKFSYLAVARNSADLPAARVIAPPRAGSGKVELKLCESDGKAQTVADHQARGRALQAGAAPRLGRDSRS